MLFVKMHYFRRSMVNDIDFSNLMKKLLFIISLITVQSISYCQTNILSGAYVSKSTLGIGFTLEFVLDTFIMRYGDEYQCDILGETIKGLFKMQNNEVIFTPLSPESFRTSLIDYSKKTYRQDRNEFDLKICDYETHFPISNFEVYIFDTIKSDIPYITLYSGCENLSFALSKSIRIDKIRLKSCGYESILLDFDHTYIGRHTFLIVLARAMENFVDRQEFSWEILEQNVDFLKVNQDGAILTFYKKHLK
jgi:hypothetical protein